ncbi:hypothetical protein [Novosphingobium sp.]|nr:hypothetical protein [Novosphingobium sp.]
MRYVFLAFAGLAIAIALANYSPKGRALKRQLMEHRAEPAKLY